MGFLVALGKHLPPSPTCHLAPKTSIPLAFPPFPPVAPYWLDSPTATFL